MCSSSKDTVATDPMRMFRTLRRKGSTSTSASTRTAPSTNSAYLTPRDGTRIGSHASFPSSSSSSNAKPASASSTSSSVPSLASLREFLPESAILYPFAEICSATNNFLARRLSSSSSNSWRCTLRGKDAVVFQRRFLGDPTSKFHHSSIARLLGASLGGDHIFLVYEYVNGASLADCLRNPKNRGFTILSTLLSRLEVAVDVAQGLEYIHHYAAIETPTPARSKTDPTRREGPVHNRITSTAIMVTDPELRAKICHFGAAELSGEIPTSSDPHDGTKGNTGDSSPKLRKNASREVRFEGTRGYIAPEVMEGGAVSQKSDVYAFGVLLLELLTGEEPLTYKYNRQMQTYESVSIVVTAREVMGGAGEQEDKTRRAVEGSAASGRHGRLRQWMDRRLNDSYPVEVVERAVRLALECVDADAGKRPDMVRVAGKMSRLLLGESRAWAEKVRLPTEISVSVGPR